MKTIQEVAREHAELYIDRGEIGNFTTVELQDVLHSAITKATAALQTENTQLRDQMSLQGAQIGSLQEQNALFKSALEQIAKMPAMNIAFAIRVAQEALKP